MTTTSLPIISTCSADGCSYNHDHDCHAAAITVTGAGAGCGTFLEGSAKGGADATGHVGACHRADCVHNDALECGADGIEVGSERDVADCLTFATA